MSARVDAVASRVQGALTTRKVIVQHHDFIFIFYFIVLLDKILKLVSRNKVNN